MNRNLTVAAAQEQILDAVSSLAPETVAVAEAQGRVLAEDILSSRILPPSSRNDLRIRQSLLGPLG